MVRIEVDGATLPADLVGVADAPAEAVEHGHDDAAGEHHDPADQQQVGDADEDDASWKWQELLKAWSHPS